MQELTAFQRDIMFVIAGHDEPHGLVIKEELEDYYTGEINHGRLYPNLDTLVEEELVEKGQKDKRTNKYQLSERGRHYIVARRKFEEKLASDITDETIITTE